MFVLECDVDCYLGPFAVRFGAVVDAVCHYAFGSLGIEQGRGVAGIDRIRGYAAAENRYYLDASAAYGFVIIDHFVRI